MTSPVGGAEERELGPRPALLHGADVVGRNETVGGAGEVVHADYTLVISLVFTERYVAPIVNR